MVRSQIEATEVEKTQAYYEKYHWKITLKRMIKDGRLYLMLLPLAIIFILWRYLPMYGLLISFKDAFFDFTSSQARYALSLTLSDFLSILIAFSVLFSSALFKRTLISPSSAYFFEKP